MAIFACDKIGRKVTIQAAAIPVRLGISLQAHCNSVTMLLIGKFIASLGCGTWTVAVPIIMTLVT